MNEFTSKDLRQRGKVIIITAPSGTGKTTLARRLMKDLPHLKFSVSATTRTPRKEEQHGIDYFFISPERFDEAINNREFLEWEEFYGGYRYGTFLSDVEKMLKNGYHTLMDLEVKGALNVKSHYGDESLAIFISPPSDKVLYERLKNRGTESKQSLQMRMERARMELKYAPQFDHLVINDQLDQCYKELFEIVTSFLNITTIH